MIDRIGLRQARNFIAVAQTQSFSRAAQRLMRSQPAVTKTIQELERQCELALFERSSRGVRLTPCGTSILPELQEAAAAFKRAEQVLPSQAERRSIGAGRIFCMDVSDHWIDAFIAVADCGSLTAAARSLGITPSAVSISIRKLEDTLCLPCFERTVAGVVPTRLSSGLLDHIKLALHHLRRAGDEVRSLHQGRHGRVKVGTLPSAQTTIVPQATLRLLQESPQVDVSTMEASYEELVAALKCGAIDFIVGTLRGGGDPDLHEERLLDDHLSLVARKGHELERLGRIEWPDLARFEWILSIQDTPARLSFTQAIRRRGLALPKHVIESSSFAMLRSVLLESDRVTVCSRHQIYYEEMHGLLTTLPFDLQEARCPIGMTYRIRGAPTLAALSLMRKVRDVSAADAVSHQPPRRRSYLLGQPCMGLSPP